MTPNRLYDLSRRGAVRSMIGGSMLLPGIVSELLAEEGASNLADPLAPKPTHFPAKAKRVIFLFMSGGVSHVDSWDPKPRLIADSGKTIPVNEFQGRKGEFKMFLKRPQWEFQPHGQSGIDAVMFPVEHGALTDFSAVSSPPTLQPPVAFLRASSTRGPPLRSF